MDNKKLENLRHTTAHLLAASVLAIWPNTKITIGPVIENGFYYDFDFENPISDKDFNRIEQKMHEIVKLWDKNERIVINVDDIKEKYKNNPYKLELIEELANKNESITIYKTGSFEDLCRGGHIENPAKEIKYFKLLSTAGAYWRGDEKNKMLTRIYGTCFFTKEDLDKYLWQIEEAKKRDHRKLGKELDLFLISEDIGKGLPLLTPKGTAIRNQILNFEYRLETENGFMHVITPHIARSQMYKKTGHWDHYRDVMYAPFGIDDEEYVLKPMNCPHHYMIYSSKPRSYRDLPFRLTEPGMCYRYEKTGELSGLLRVRALSIDDSHILMNEEQIEGEFKRCIDMIKQMFASFHLKDYYVRLSLSDPSDAVKYISDRETWEKAGNKLEKIVKDNKLNYKIAKGEASFYGPKLDFMVKDSLGREWQMSTLQLDLFMAKRLNLTYVDVDGQEKHPVILHRGLTGSIERTMGILIEHFSGMFPLWLAPVQVAVIPVSDKFADFAQKVEIMLKQSGIRVETNTSQETVGKKIRVSTLQKVPYMVIIGDREIEKSKENKVFVSVRTREGQDIGQLDIVSFTNKLKEQIENHV